MSPNFGLAMLFLIVMCAIYIWDAYMLASGIDSQTVSRILREWSMSQPVLPFFIGLLIGHLFW